MRGYLRLNNVYHISQEFEVEVYTEIGDIAANIGDKKCTDLDLSAYDHVQSYTNVTGSWAGSLHSGAVVYPLMDWGIGYTAYDRTITDNTVGVKLYDFKPAIQLKVVIEKMLEDAGYTVDQTTDFWSSDFFLNQFLILGCENEASLPAPSYQMVVENPNVDFAIAATYTLIEFETQVNPINQGDLWNDTTWKFTAPNYGEYQFRVSIFGRSVGNVSNNTSFELFVNGSASGLAQTWTSGTASFGTALNYTFTITLDGGDEVDFRAKENSDTVVILEGSIVELAAYPLNVSGSLINISALLPTAKQVDLLKTLINNNNLVIESDPNDNTLLIINDYNTWLTLGEVKDWTTKIDTTKDIVSTPLFQLRKKDILFSHLEDNDLNNAAFQTFNGRVFGEYKLLDESPLSTDGLQSNFTICSPYAISAVLGTNLTIYKHFTFNTDGTVKSLKAKPKIAIFETTRSCTTWYIEKSDTDNSKASQTVFPIFSEYSNLTSGYADSDSLVHNWYRDTPANQPLIWDSASVPALGSTLFERNYRYQLDQIYSDEALQLVGYFYLTDLDFKQLSFNDTILIENGRYRLINIETFTLNYPSTVKCTFLKIITED